MQTRKLVSFFLLVFLVFSLFPFVLRVTEAQTYLFDLSKWDSVFRLPTFALTGWASSIKNKTDSFQWNITVSGALRKTWMSQNDNRSFMISTDKLAFYYQPPLVLELNVDECTFVNATHAFNGSKLLVYRPENVVGSYAVYSTTKCGNQYMTGKLFHLYRPLLVDSLGKTSWGWLNLTKNTLTIGWNKTWIQSATFPVIIDPSFGYTTVGASSGNAGFASLFVCKFTSPSDCGTLTSVSAYLNQKGATGNFGEGCVYSDNASPDANLVQSDSQQLTGSGAWQTFSLSYVAAASTDYWLGTFWNTSSVDLYWDSGTTDQLYERHSGLTYPTLPDPFGTKDNSWNFKMSIFANYTVAAGLNLVFNLFENINIQALNLFSKELGFTSTNTIQPSDVVSMSKAIGGLLTAFLSTNSIYPSANLLFNKELAFWKYDNLFNSATSTMTKAVQLTLFELFEFVKLHASNIMLPGWTALTIEIAVAIGVLALVLAICGISLVVLRRRRE